MIYIHLDVRVAPGRIVNDEIKDYMALFWLQANSIAQVFPSLITQGKVIAMAFISG